MTNAETMVDNTLKNTSQDKPEINPADISNQEPIRPHRGSIERMIVNFYLYPEERKQQHIQWLLKHNNRD